MSVSRSTRHCRVVAPIEIMSPSDADKRKFSDAVDIDKPSGAGQPHRHHGHQRLAARNNACALIGCKNRTGFVDVGWAGILKRRGFHDR